MSNSSEKGRLQLILEEFLKARGWEDELTIDAENSKTKLFTRVTFGEFENGSLIIDASDETDFVSVFFYFPFECKQSKRSEMCVLLNDFNTRGGVGGYGCFQLLDEDDDRIRWVHRVDFEGSSPTVKSLDRIVLPGWERMNSFADSICMVALTKKTASEAIEEFDALHSSDSEGSSDS